MLASLLIAAQEPPAPDRSGLAILEQVSRLVRQHDPIQISGNRIAEYEAGQPDYAGEIRLLRRGQSIRSEFTGYWGDTNLIIANAKEASIDEGWSVSRIPWPKSLAKPQDSAPFSSAGPMFLFLANISPADLADPTKAVTQIPGQNPKVKFTRGTSTFTITITAPQQIQIIETGPNQWDGEEFTVLENFVLQKPTRKLSDALFRLPTKSGEG